ncbi:hypothetical protein [Geobacillus sp. C56-T2]|uniref:hypothetical protein n=1 Tax=Geobacillus sp. C56-T2 TaxID=600773 RepID=UPI0011A9C612|nr:hypothetical protein [Geobacillus sp. C56-T2]NNV06691.1 hypothetical protein [Geobacillus sp. MMMUD3]TWG29432.1 hypothetical protein GC56T2_0480 [Geobacillus sp. C56-T2]
MIYKFFSLKSFFIFLILLASIGAFTYLYVSNYHFVKNTNLANSSLAGLRIGKKLDSSDIRRIEATFGPEIKNRNIVVLVSAPYEKSLSYDGLFIGLREGKVVTIVAENKKALTNKGIKPGDHLEKIQKKYGKNYLSTSEEIGETVLYIDRKSGIKIQFVMYDNKVKQSILTELY